MRRSATFILASLVLGTITTLVLAWPCAVAAAALGGAGRGPAAAGARGAGGAGGKLTNPGREFWWADDDVDGRKGWGVPHAGRYFHQRHGLSETIDFRRIIFVGEVNALACYRIDPPPNWAATISTNMREGFEQVITTVTGWPRRCFRMEHWISWRDGPPAPRLIQVDGMPPIQLPGLPTDPPTPPPERLVSGWTVPPSLPGLKGGKFVLPTQPMWDGLLANILLFSAGWWVMLIASGVLRRSLRRRRGLCPGCGYDLRATPNGRPCPECGAAQRVHAATVIT